MTDIQQWRRMIQPARVRTPAVDVEEPEVHASPATPRRPLRPTFTTNKPRAPAPLPEDFDSAFRIPSWILNQPNPDPPIDELIDSIMCNVMDDPSSGLTARFATDLMRIIEAYRLVRDEKEELASRLQAETQKRHAVAQAWDRERKEYKAEVKRLELLLSKGKRGVAEVTLARQDSLVRRGSRRDELDDTGLETIFEFLEKTKRYDDRAWSSQRGEGILPSYQINANRRPATMRVKSPSAKMRRISQSLATKKSMTNIHDDLPFGTPPSSTVSVLHRAYNSDAVIAGHPSQSEPKTSMSDDTSSTFSCVGGLLPDENFFSHVGQMADRGCNRAYTGGTWQPSRNTQAQVKAGTVVNHPSSQARGNANLLQPAVGIGMFCATFLLRSV
jgi:hypothetical protein